MSYSGFEDSYLSSIKTLYERENRAILKQLGEIIEKGDVVVVRQEPVLTRERGETGKYEYKLSGAVYLKSAHREKIEKLEKENAELKEIIRKIKEIEL